MSEPRTILLVDDDQSLRRVLEYQLQEDGFRVVAVASGEAAIERFGAVPLDIVVTDVKMPAMDGIELMSRLKALQPDLPVIVLTAHGTIGSAVEAMKLGAFDYLTKPFSREQLRVSVGKALDVAAIKSENRRLREIVAERFSFSSMIAGSRAMRGVIETASRVAPTDTTVLLCGESGTGKELLAKAIHLNSERRQQAFVTVNCAAIPETLVESELFGHRRGAFTGATADRQGKFEAANRGTIFLDEIGELPMQMQVKILRVLQERQIDKVGESRPISVDVRIIASTNRDLEKMIEDGSFREDLYYRLAVVAIRLPPLRERADDIPFLIDDLLAKHSARLGRPRPSVDGAVYTAFNLYTWRGNIRELENVLERAMVLDRDGIVGLDDLPERIRAHVGTGRLGRLQIELPDDGISLEDVERELLLAALEKHDWNQTRAAAYLNITRSTLLYRIQKYRLERGRLPRGSEGSQ
jgi:DNA-binding NtrC family response regulator